MWNTRFESPRRLLVAAWRAGVAAVHGETLLRTVSRLEGDRWYLGLPQGRERCVVLPSPADGGRLRVLGAGKAAASLARGIEAVLGERIDAGRVVVKHGHAEPLRRACLLEAGHPLPDAASVQAAAAMLAFIERSAPTDLYLVLLTGGASALLAAPAAGLTLEDKAQVSRLLVECGASIQQINVVRRHLSRIKGGQLARALAPARSITLAISDVLGDDPATIGSGPTVADPSTYAEALAVLRQFELAASVPPAVLRRLQAGVEGRLAETPKPGDGVLQAADYVVLAGLREALAAAVAAARGMGCEVVEWTGPLAGDTHSRAREFAGRLRQLAMGRGRNAPPLLLVAGGETTLQVRGGGRGGRCQEFATRVAGELEGVAGLAVLAAGTDGTDGPTAAAGGFADGGTWPRARQAGLDPAALLADNDTHRLLAASGDLFVTGPTGTNVADLMLGIAMTAGESPAERRLP
ncbi:MAG: DUF4147 domain-containing protein [Sinobacteraceae bacterium]|nr:DUF4147 domain-containing protein [Nevskiaceae bacterium]